MQDILEPNHEAIMSDVQTIPKTDTAKTIDQLNSVLAMLRRFEDQGVKSCGSVGVGVFKPYILFNDFAEFQRVFAGKTVKRESCHYEIVVDGVDVKAYEHTNRESREVTL